MADLKQLQEKWAPVLDHEALPKIEDSHKSAVVAQLLENQEFAAAEEKQMLTEAPTMPLALVDFLVAQPQLVPVAGFDPVLISLIRRSMPQLIAYDIAGVQPMTGPTGLIFAMRSNYGTGTNPAASGYDEAFFNGFNAGFSGGDTSSTYDPSASSLC